MTASDRARWARDLESQGLHAAAAEMRAGFAAPISSVEVARAAREAEAVGDWSRWAELLSLESSAPAGPTC